MVCYFWNRASIACVFLFCFYRKMKFSTMSIVRIVENIDSTRDVHESRGQLVSISPDSVRTPILRWVCIINEQRVDQLVFGSDFAVCTLLLSSSFLPDKSSSFLAWTENGKVKDVDEMMKHQKCEKLPWQHNIELSFWSRSENICSRALSCMLLVLAGPSLEFCSGASSCSRAPICP